MDKINMYSGTSTSAESTPLTVDVLNKAVEELKKIKSPVIFFTPLCPEESIFHGEWLDKMLGCAIYEKAYMMHISKKEIVAKQNFKYREGRPVNHYDYERTTRFI